MTPPANERKTMQTVVEKIEARPVNIGGITSGSRRSVTDDATGILIGYVVSDAGPATLGDATLTHIDRYGDVADGGTVTTDSGVALALRGQAGLYKIFPAR
jgi:hypothetical protein